MPHLLAFNLGGQELLVILAIALLLFGSTRLPKLARSMGQSVSEFKKGIRQDPSGDEGVEEPSKAAE
jgi:sec-independent protein translocase protein TatA